MKEALSVEDTLKLALEALERLLLLAEHEGWEGFDKQYAAITAIKEALMSLQDGAQPAVTESHKQSTTCGEPVAWMQTDEVHISLWKDDYHTIPLYTTPPQRTAAEGEDTKAWVGLTDDEIMDMYNEPRSDAEMVAFGREVEAKLKAKNERKEKNNVSW